MRGCVNNWGISCPIVVAVCPVSLKGAGGEYIGPGLVWIGWFWVALNSNVSHPAGTHGRHEIDLQDRLFGGKEADLT